MPVTINASTSTGLVQSADTSGEIELQSNGTTALKVNTNEGIQILNCLGVGNATPSTSGAGITFPATQSASTDANTLDDYEEGTFTPTVAASSVTYNSRYGHYTKIGDVVFISCYVNIASISSPTGGAGANFINGLPFTSRAAVNAYYPNFATSWNGSNFGGTVGMAQIAPSQASLSALASTNNSNFVDSNPADIWDAAGNWVKVTGFYYV